jgi:hypothetical protein
MAQRGSFGGCSDPGGVGAVPQADSCTAGRAIEVSSHIFSLMPDWISHQFTG